MLYPISQIKNNVSITKVLPNTTKDLCLYYYLNAIHMKYFIKVNY